MLLLPFEKQDLETKTYALPKLKSPFLFSDRFFSDYPLPKHIRKIAISSPQFFKTSFGIFLKEFFSKHTLDLINTERFLDKIKKDKNLSHKYMKNFFLIIMTTIAGSSFAIDAKQWVYSTLPDSLKQPTASPTDRLEYLKQQDFPEGITLSEIIDAILDME